MSLSRSSVFLLSIFSIGGLGASSAHRDFLARSGFYGPRSEMRYAKPTLRWEIWSDDGTVTASEMDVNGSAVEARYDPDAHSLLFTPSDPLPVGVNKVHCSVTFNNSYTFTRDWNATINPTAIADLPQSNPQQLAALAAANELRQRLGLPNFVSDVRLNAAAQAHSDYLTKNNLRGHGERSTDAGFIGADPSSRLEAFGWGGPSWEGLTYMVGDPRQSVKMLFDAPYHRLPFLQPGAQQFGFGMNGQTATAEFQGTKDECVAVSPGDGETDVPTSWCSRETPDPMAIHPEVPSGATIGYPIMLAQFGPGKEHLDVQTATLSDGAGNPVQVFVNMPVNDVNLTNAVVILPNAPLKQSMLYKVSVTATGSDGKPIQKSWSFRTAGAVASHVTSSH